MSKDSLKNIVLVLAAVSLLGSYAKADEPACAFTADTEGHVWPGDCCGDKDGQGCLPRRATIVAGLRKDASSMLLLDAGNFLFGPGSLDSKGQVMVVAYDAIGYDAANISYRDFRFGKAQTLSVLMDARFSAVSANLLDDQSKSLLFKPYVIKQSQGQKVAILGLTELPSGLAKLPHVAQQLAGVTVRAPADALADWLPKAKADADRVIILYYGSPAGLKVIQDKAGDDVKAIFVGGMRPDQLPDGGTPPVAATFEFGQQIAKVSLPDGRLGVTQIPVNAKVAIDQPTKKLLAQYAPKSPQTAVAAAPAVAAPNESQSPTAAPSPAAAAAASSPMSDVKPADVLAADALRSGPAKSTAVGQSKGLVLKITQIELSSDLGGVKPSAGGVLAVLETEWTNRLGMAQEIPDLATHVYLVVNGRRLASLHAKSNGVKGGLPTGRLKFPDRGSVITGKLVFDVPASDVDSLELRYLDTTSGDITLPLVGKSLDNVKPLAGPLKNRSVAMSVYSLNKVAIWGDRKAPAGMTFAVVELCAESVNKKDGSHLDLAQMPGWRKYAYMIVDGEYAQAPLTGGVWPDRLFAIPEVATGGSIAFLVPLQCTSLELRMDFPSLDTKDSTAAIVLPLEGKAEACAPRKPIASVTDEMFQVDFTGQDVLAAIDDNHADQGRKFLLIDVSVANTGKSGQWFQVKKQLQYLTGKDQKIQMDDVTQRCIHGCSDTLWVPANMRRSFQIVFQVPLSDSKVQLAFTGAKSQQTIAMDAMGESAAGGQTPQIPAASSMPSSSAMSDGPVASTAADPAQVAPPTGQRVLSTVKSGDVVVFDPSLKPKGLAGVGLTQAEVDAAILKGRQYLWGKIKSTLTAKQQYFDDREQILACLALVHAGALSDTPQLPPVIKNTLLNTKVDFNDTYRAGVLAMLAEASGDEDCRGLFKLTSRYFVEAQGINGTWTYRGSIKEMHELLAKVDFAPPSANATASAFKVTGGRPIAAPSTEVFKRTSPAQVGADGDNSNTQFAVMGLWTAARSGLAIDANVWQRCLKTLRARQNSDGSCGYEGGEGYGSMTCAFICISAIAQSHLGDDPVKDRAIHRAIAWMVNNWSVKENPKHGKYLYYYLYSLERVGRCLDIDFIGDKEWFPLGARFLVDQQHADGGWGESKTSNILDTSFALLFLTKATATLTPPPTGGEGVLATEGPSIRADRIYFILDASTSMNQEIDGKGKFKIAQESILAVIKALPDQTQVALRVYGNHLTDHPKGPDEDSTLEIPLAKLDKKAFAKKLQELYARGKTPLAYSMEQAAEDLRGAGASVSSPVSVVLLTDGWESTAKKRDPVASAKVLGDVEGVMLNVVALDVNAANEVKQLQAIANAANGQYWPASDADKLLTYVQKAISALPGRFVVLDSAGNKVADGLYGQDIPLKEGKYVLKATVDGKEVQQPFWINTGRTTRIVYEGSKPSAK